MNLFTETTVGGAVLGSFFIGGLLISHLVLDKEAVQMKKDYDLAIAICETALPRNQFCDAKWDAFVKPKETILVGLRGKKETIVKGE